MSCRFCKENKPLIEAHILPLCFWGDYEEEKYVMIDTKGGFPKRRPKGVYDKNILCVDCDCKELGVYDQYAKELLIDRISEFKRPDHPLYEIPTKALNYEKLKKFFISLIWRASISKNELCEQVSLGLYEDIALRILKEEIPLSDEVFSVLIFKDAANINFQNTVSFVRTKLARKTAYKIHFSGYQVTIVPKSSDMVWDCEPDTCPALLFMRRGSAFLICESDRDLSGKTDLLELVRKRYSAKRT